MKCFFICVCLLCVMIQAAPSWSANPYETLEKASRALETSDETLFEQTLDLDALINEALDSFLVQTRQENNALPATIGILLNQLVGASRNNPLRTLLVAELHEFVLNGIRSGAFKGEQTGNETCRGLLAPLLANASMAKKEISSMGDARRVDNGYIVPFMVHDYGNGQYYYVEGFFDECDLRLKSIANIDALVGQILREAAQ